MIMIQFQRLGQAFKIRLRQMSVYIRVNSLVFQEDPRGMDG
jgi:hypothetical protein